MRVARGKVDLLIVSSVAIMLVVTAFVGIAGAVGPPAGSPVLTKGQYKLPAQALADLPSAIALEKQATSAPGSPTRSGIQFFQSPAGVFGMFLVSGQAQPAGRLAFPVSGVWTFLPDKRFEQRDPNGNRLIVEDGKAQVFNNRGVQFGALQNPALGALYRALLRLTM